MANRLAQDVRYGVRTLARAPGFTAIALAVLSRLIELYTVNPAKLLGIDRGTLSVGSVADVTIIDTGMEWTVNKEQSASRSRNNPFHGWQLKGRAVRTIVGGETVWSLS